MPEEEKHKDVEQRIRVLETEVADHRETEDQVKALNSVLRAVRNVNQLITHAKDHDSLLQEACNLLVKARDFFNAWIVLFDRPQDLKVAYQTGLGESFQAMVERLRQGDLTHCFRKALEHPDVVFTQDPASQCADCPLAS
ncbi:MAG: hypothetical protein DRH50_17190, partial [Deltaproteobacteria bacterium]